MCQIPVFQRILVTSFQQAYLTHQDGEQAHELKKPTR